MDAASKRHRQDWVGWVKDAISGAQDAAEHQLLMLGERINILSVAGAVFVPFLVYIAVL
jgi:hypothetical protein